ncbi:hypothetical protein [uncultured Friedmanniella sp.]|uniref:hypothetical protein n=1 Tax=uncultured Friedmanniella sp. TaxID=335381 RepID=UPI0035CAE214
MQNDHGHLLVEKRERHPRFRKVHLEDRLSVDRADLVGRGTVVGVGSEVLAGDSGSLRDNTVFVNMLSDVGAGRWRR